MDADPSKIGTKMTSFGDDYEQLENCGVDFDSTCLNKYEEECGEDDEQCFARFLQRQNSTVPSNRYSSKSLAVSDRISASNSRGTPVSPTVLPPVLPPPFEGLPKNYFKKNFKPDYPTELQMKRVCAPRAQRRRTLGSTRTQPKAVFIPSYSTLQKQETRSVPSLSAAFSVSGKNIAVNGAKTSIPKEALRDIFTNDPSPLEENRLPPPVVSSSDEVVVDWIESHNVQMMFEYFLGLCVIYQPEDPWVFISEICGKLMQARNDLGAFYQLPRILAPEHTEAIFRIYDRIENGYITVPQYKSAMEAMGLNVYSASLEGWEDNAISRDTFVQEATDAINNLLRTFMVCEECEEQASEDKASSESQDLQRTKSMTGGKQQREDSSASRTTSSTYSNSRSGTGSDGTLPTADSYGLPQNVNSVTAEEDEEEEEDEGEEEALGTVASATVEGDGTVAPETVASTMGAGDGTVAPETVASTTGAGDGTVVPMPSTTREIDGTKAPAPDASLGDTTGDANGTGEPAPDTDTIATIAK